MATKYTFNDTITCGTNMNSDDYGPIAQYARDHGVEYIYHFTAIENLNSIVEKGGLFSRKYLEENEIEIPFAGGNSLSHSLDSKLFLDNYVHLSFCERHPMGWCVKQRNESEKIIVLKISINILDKPGILFCNMNATKNLQCKIIDQGLNGIRSVNFDAVNMKYVSHDMNEYDFHQAEIMIPRCVELEYFDRNFEEY